MFDALREYFEIILVGAFLISALAYAVYRMTFFKHVKADFVANKNNWAGLPRKERKQLKHNILATHLNSFFKKTVFFFADLFWVLLFVVVVRGFLVEPFVIPSGSMKPGLQIRDIVIVNKYSKGLRMPITNTRLTDGESIQRGDVLVFKYPNNPKVSYIKRVIGLPGDRVYYDNRQMTINGQSVTLEKIQPINDTVEMTFNGDKISQTVPFTIFEEDLLGFKNTIRYADNNPADYVAREWVVPEGKYFMLGDNRDSSADGRAFGYLDDDLVIGKATRILFNWGCVVGKGKCDRFFKAIK